MTPGPANDEERLPWLEPHRATMPPKQRVARRSRGGQVAVAGAFAVLFAAGGGYWLGLHDPGRVATAPATSVALAPVSQAPAARPAPVVPPPIAEVIPPVEAEAAPVVKKVAVSKSKQPVRSAVQQRKIRRANIESARLKQVRAAQVRAAQARAAQRRARAARPAPRAWPRMPSPGPAGQVIQLGAFRTPAGANRAYRTRLARYPTLGSMPRVVVPVATKPRGQVLYVLRLGTTSRQQSRIVCRNLRASGDHCLVIG